MRKFVVLAGTAMLGACGSGGSSISSAPPPASTPSTPSTGSAPGNTHTFANPTEAKTYVGVGASHVFTYSTYGTPADDADLSTGQSSQLYAGNATTARNSGISIAYDPRDAIFTLAVTDNLSGASTSTRFQDPAHRTDFGGVVQPQWGTPNLNNPNARYLEVGTSSGPVTFGDTTHPDEGKDGGSSTGSTLIYIKPGTETNYATIAAYLTNTLSWKNAKLNGADALRHDWRLERGAFAFGELSNTANVPKTGTGTYNGSMLATMVFNPTLDGQDQSGLTQLSTYFQWLSGTSKTTVDFGASTFALSLKGTAFAPQFDYHSGNQTTVIKEGAVFTAAGKGTINLVSFGGFKGAFDTASFVNPNGGSTYNVAIAGSSIDGAFYGPNGEEVGGGYRIVGGTPDERIDILGAFVGKK